MLNGNLNLGRVDSVWKVRTTHKSEDARTHRQRYPGSMLLSKMGPITPTIQDVFVASEGCPVFTTSVDFHSSVVSEVMSNTYLFAFISSRCLMRRVRYFDTC